MKTPDIPPDEHARLDALRALNLLDTGPEERFDRLTRIARRLFGVPISLISTVDADRQWFKSNQGLDAEETSRDISFCGHAILGDDLFLIPDALADERFADNPLVVDNPGIRFYAGVPLKVLNGSKLGTLCILDREPRDFDQEDLDLLRDLARMAEQEISAVQMSTLDELTLISNRRGFVALAQHTINLCRRRKQSATLLFFDIDDFKSVNDRFGHAEGDRALITFAEAMRRELRDSDVFARLGGDEFVALVADTDEAGTELMLTRLRTAVDLHNTRARRGYDIQFSVGYVRVTIDGKESVDELLEFADAGMYRDKASRRASGEATSASRGSPT